MQNYFFICRSVTYAQRTARILERAGISAVVTRTPRQVPAEGCSYCVRVPEHRMTEALVALKASGMPPARVYTQHADGVMREVDI